jgi:pyrroline-5-carboxylate reductase
MAKNISFIGAGNMAGAIIGGILEMGIAQPNEIAVYDISTQATAYFASRGVVVKQSIKDAAEFSDIIFLSVKPQNYEEVLAELSNSVDETKVLVSIAAGISTSFIKQRIGFDCKVVRVMPNTPLLLGEGATAICHCPPVSDDEFAQVLDIFKAGGIVEVLPEEKMNAVIAVNGSSPAYVYLFAKSLIDGAEHQGIDADTAKKLVCKTLVGSASMLMESGKSPDELIKMVSSKGGTTIAALDALYEHGFEAALIDAMERCTKRAEELGK